MHGSAPPPSLLILIPTIKIFSKIKAGIIVEQNEMWGFKYRIGLGLVESVQILVSGVDAYKFCVLLEIC